MSTQANSFAFAQLAGAESQRAASEATGHSEKWRCRAEVVNVTR
jgi:hypothetical protein